MRSLKVFENKEFVVPTVVLGMLLLKLFCIAFPNLAYFLMGESFPINIHASIWIMFLIGVGLTLSRLFAVRRLEKNLFGFSSKTEEKDFNFTTLRTYCAHASPKEGQFMKELFKALYDAKRSGANRSDLYSTTDLKLDLFLHQIDIFFASIKYMVWAIPSLGLVGTILGISLTVGEIAGNGQVDMSSITNIVSGLSLAFDTTIIATVLAIILNYFYSVTQTRFEKHINTLGSIFVTSLTKL